MEKEFIGIDDRIFNKPIYKEKEISEDRLYYIFSKGKEYITVSGVGDDLNNIKDIRWHSSKGARGVLEQMIKIESGYSPRIGFVKFDDYPNNIYIQIARFQSIYKDGWRYNRSNISNELKKMQSKKKVYVKPSKRAKGYYRTQAVGREEIDPKKINYLWDITPGVFSRLVSGSKLELQEKYIEEHNYKYSDDHPELQKIIDLMDEDHAEFNFPRPISFFNSDKLKQAIYRKLGRNEYVPLYVLKDYPEAAYSYDIDISDKALEQEPPRGKITHLTEMTKNEYDSIIESAKKDYETDPKKITDSMINQYYADELEDVKRSAKLRKKIFNNLPEIYRQHWSPETMNNNLHQMIIKDIIFNNPHVDFGNKSKIIPDSVKKEYPMLFKEIPINFKITGDKNTDKTINEILEKIRAGITDLKYHKNLDDTIHDIIGSTGEIIPIKYNELLDENEKKLVQSGVDDISKKINPKLLERIKKSGKDITIRYVEERKRSAYHPEYGLINLGKNVIDADKMQYDQNTICHEYGHAIEDMVPEISKLCSDFLKYRTTDDPLIPLNKVLPNSNYSDNEFTKVDNFISAYIGKHYNDRGTEILSMGMGCLTSSYLTTKLYDSDPGYLGLIVGILSGKIGIKDE
jgi:hypothetical protein